MRLARVLPTGLQADGRPWTAAAVQKVIRTRFKMKVSRSTAWRYLQRAARESEQPSLFLQGHVETQDSVAVARGGACDTFSCRTVVPDRIVLVPWKMDVMRHQRVVSGAGRSAEW